MCDCYETECGKKGCMEIIPVHIADYSFPRKDVQVFCGEHLPKEKVTIFEVIKECEAFKEEEKWDKVGWRCAIRLCKGEIEPEAVGVCPNIGAIYKTETKYFGGVK